MTDIELRVSALEEQVSLLLKSRPGRQLRPIVTSEPHVCGLDPSRDSATCPEASIWRRSKGCKGDACVAKSSDYYKNYRATKKANSGEEASPEG